jgi:hypothetical protein
MSLILPSRMGEQLEALVATALGSLPRRMILSPSCVNSIAAAAAGHAVAGKGS